MSENVSFFGFDSESDFNRYLDLDGIEQKIIYALVDSKSHDAKYLWRMLKDSTEKCLINACDTDPSDNPDDVTYKKNRYKLVYQDTGVSTAKKVFAMPYVDDAWMEQSARLDVFVDGITPVNNIMSKLDIRFEIIVHNKINNIKVNSRDYTQTEKEEMVDGTPIVKFKSRTTTMLKCLLSELNGRYLDGVGMLQHNTQISPYSVTRNHVWNNKAYIGYSVVMSTFISKVSENSDYTW